MILSDLEWLSEIFNDTKHRAVSLRQLSFLLMWRCDRGNISGIFAAVNHGRKLLRMQHSLLRNWSELRSEFHGKLIVHRLARVVCRLPPASNSSSNRYRTLTLYRAMAIIVPRRITWTWYAGRWRVGCYIWYSEEGIGRGRSPPTVAQFPPRCTKCNSPPINGHCTNHRIVL